MAAKAEKDSNFATRLAIARSRKDTDSHQGLFVKNLENVQGDERDVIIICTTFGPDFEGKFRRNFGALNRPGGGRRLNVLVTRARQAVHIVTSIPRSEYAAMPEIMERAEPNGRYHLYAYLAWAEHLAEQWRTSQNEVEHLTPNDSQRCLRGTARPISPVAESVSKSLFQHHQIGSISHWGNDGFCVDAALIHPRLPSDVTLGVLTDFSRYRRTRDPIVWDLFRTSVLRSQGWLLQRLWSPSLLRRHHATLENVAQCHHERTGN
jgi:hypothetical protein